MTYQVVKLYSDTNWRVFANAVEEQMEWGQYALQPQLSEVWLKRPPAKLLDLAASLGGEVQDREE